MENNISKKNEIILIDDMINDLESKIYNMIGLLELAGMGIGHIDSTNNSYELSSMNVLKDYLSLINKTDIPKLHEMLKQLSERE